MYKRLLWARVCPYEKPTPHTLPFAVAKVQLFFGMHKSKQHFYALFASVLFQQILSNMAQIYLFDYCQTQISLCMLQRFAYIKLTFITIMSYGTYEKVPSPPSRFHRDVEPTLSRP